MQNSEIPSMRLVEAFYDANAKKNPRFAAVLGEPSDFALAYREYQEFRTFCDVVKLSRSLSVVELGSGGGRWLESLSPLVKSIVGVELSAECISVARERLSHVSNCTLIHANIQDFHPTETFNLLYYSGVLLYLNDDELKTCVASHMKTQGEDVVVIIRDSIATTQSHKLTHLEGYEAFYRTVDDWRSLMDTFGLRILSHRVSNPCELRDSFKRSRFMSFLYSISSRIGLSGLLFRAVSQLRFAIRSEAQWPGYSHDFIVFGRNAK